MGGFLKWLVGDRGTVGHDPRTTLEAPIIPGTDAMSSSSSDTATYMVAELQVLHLRAVQAEQNASGKISFFLAGSTGVLGAVILSAQNPMILAHLGEILMGALALLTAAGLLTLAQTLDLYVSSIFFYRRMGRIRRWFADQNPHAAIYMPFRVGDDNPMYFAPYAPTRGIEALLVLTNSLFVGAVFAIGGYLGIGSAWALAWLNYFGIPDAIRLGSLVAFGLGTAWMAWHMQRNYIKRFLMTREEKERAEGKVRFPSDG